MGASGIPKIDGDPRGVLWGAMKGSLRIMLAYRLGFRVHKGLGFRIQGLGFRI